MKVPRFLRYRRLARVIQDYQSVPVENFEPISIIYLYYDTSGDGELSIPMHALREKVSVLDKLECHQSVHTGVLPWLCWVCGFRTVYPSNYRVHLARCQAKMGESAENYPCPEDGCMKSYFSCEALDIHLKTHSSGSENLLCDICRGEFVSERDYEQLGKAHGPIISSLWEGGFTTSGTPVPVNTKEKQMKEYLDQIGEVYTAEACKYYPNP